MKCILKIMAIVLAITLSTCILTGCIIAKPFDDDTKSSSSAVNFIYNLSDGYPKIIMDRQTNVLYLQFGYSRFGGMTPWYKNTQGEVWTAEQVQTDHSPEFTIYKSGDPELIYDTYSHIMYVKYSGDKGVTAVSVLYNADGTLKTLEDFTSDSDVSNTNIIN